MNYPKHDDLYPSSCPEANTWIKHVPVISTAHICKEDAKLILTGRFPGTLQVLVSGDTVSGHLLTTDCEDTNLFSTSFCHLLLEFGMRGYRWIILDRDGDKVDLPTFEW